MLSMQHAATLLHEEKSHTDFIMKHLNL